MALLLAMMVDSPGQSRPEPPRQNPGGTQQRTNTEQRDTDQAPPSIIKKLPAEDTQQKPAADEQKGPDNRSDTWALSDKIAVIASIVALLQFFALVGTIFVLTSTARRQLRAYVGTTSSPNNFPSLNIGQRQSGDILVTGYGQTPALKMRYWGNIIIREYPLATSLPIQPFRKTCRPINPKQTIVMAFVTAHQLTAAEVQEIRAGTQCFYIYGVIEYFDIFGERRETTFRYWYGPFAARPCWITCEEGNDQT
jgi:hypothetical protein